MTPKNPVKYIWHWLTIAEDAGRITTIVSMTMLVFIQVMLRVFLNWSSPAWEEAARFIMIWSIFIGAIVTTREDEHIKMGGIFRSKEKRLILEVVSKLLCVVFMFIFVKWSYDFALYSIEKSMQSIVLRVPLIVVHICFFVCGILMAIHFLIHLITRARELISYRKVGTQC